MLQSAGVDDRRCQQRCQAMGHHDPAAVNWEAVDGSGCFSCLRDDVETSRSGWIRVEEDSSELTSGVLDAAVPSQYDTGSRKCRRDAGVDSPHCERRERSPADTNRQEGRIAAELFPVPLVTSSVTCHARSSLAGVGRALPVWLPWLLLSMTSFGLVTSLPVDSDASRAPVKVFDGSANSAGVDAPVRQSTDIIFIISLSALTLLVGRQEELPACKN